MADVASGIPIQVGAVSGVTETIATARDRRLILRKRHPDATIPVAVGPARQIASVEVMEDCTGRGSLFRRNRVADRDGGVIDLVQTEREVGRGGRRDAVANRELQPEGAVEVVGADEAVLAGAGGDGDRTSLDVGSLVDVDRRIQSGSGGGDGGAGAVHVGQAGHAERGRRDVEVGVGVRVSATRQQVARNRAGFVNRGRRLGFSRRGIVGLSDRQGERTRRCIGTSGTVQDGVGDLDRTVVVGRTREAVETFGTHRQRTRDDVGRRTVLTGVDRDRGVAGGVIKNGTRGIRDVGELRDREGRRGGVGGRYTVRVDIVGQDIARDHASFVDGIGIVDTRGVVTRAGDRYGQGRATAGGVAVTRHVGKDEFAVPVCGAREFIGARGGVDADIAGLDERARLAVLPFGIDRKGGTERGGFLLNARGVEIVELLDHDGGPRSVQRSVRVDVRIVAEQIAGNQGAFFAGFVIDRSVGVVIGSRIDEIDRAGGRTLRAGRGAAVAVVVDLDQEGVVDVVVAQRDVGKRRDSRIDVGLGAREFDDGVTSFHAIREGQAGGRTQRQGTQIDSQGDGQFGIVGLFRVYIGDADSGDRLGDVFRDCIAVGSGDCRGVVDLVDREVDRVRLRQQAVREGVADLRERAVDRVEVRTKGDKHVAVGQDVDIAEVGDGRHLVSVEDGQGAVDAVSVNARDGVGQNRQGVAVGVGDDPCEEIAGVVATLVEGERGGAGRRTVVGPDGRGRADVGTLGIDRRVGDRGETSGTGTTEVSLCWGEDERTIGADQERTAAIGHRVGGTHGERTGLTRDGVRLNRQVGAIFNVRIVVEERTLLHRTAGRLIHIDSSRRRIVHRGDGDAERGGGRQFAIGDDVADGRDAAVPIKRRREFIGSVTVERQRADGAVGTDGNRRRRRVGGEIRREAVEGERVDEERGALDVAIIGENAAGNRGGSVFRAGIGVIRSNRCIVDGREADLERDRLLRNIRAIGTDDGDRVEGAVPVRRRGECVAAVGIDDQAALPCDLRGIARDVDRVVACNREGSDGDVVAFDVGGVMQDVAGKGDVFRADIGGIRKHRGIIDCRDGKVEHIAH